MKVNHDGVSKSIPANHALYQALTALVSDGQRDSLYSRFIELSAMATQWKYENTFSANKLYSLELGARAKYIVFELEKIVPGITDIKSQGFRSLAKYEKVSGGWQAWIENSSAVKEYWFERCGRSARRMSDFSLYHQVKFIELFDGATRVFDMDKRGHYGEAVQGVYADLELREGVTPFEIETRRLVGVFKLQFEAFINDVYHGKPKLTNAHCLAGTEVNNHGNELEKRGHKYAPSRFARQRRAAYPTTVTNGASHQIWTNWVINFLWDAANSHRFFGFLAWLEQHPEVAAMGNLAYDSIPRSFGYVTYSKYNDFDAFLLHHPDIACGELGIGQTVEQVFKRTVNNRQLDAEVSEGKVSQYISELFDSEGNVIVVNNHGKPRPNYTPTSVKPPILIDGSRNDVKPLSVVLSPILVNTVTVNAPLTAVDSDNGTSITNPPSEALTDDLDPVDEPLTADLDIASEPLTADLYIASEPLTADLYIPEFIGTVSEVIPEFIGTVSEIIPTEELAEVTEPVGVYSFTLFEEDVTEYIIRISPAIFNDDTEEFETDLYYLVRALFNKPSEVTAIVAHLNGQALTTDTSYSTVYDSIELAMEASIMFDASEYPSYATDTEE